MNDLEADLGKSAGDPRTLSGEDFAARDRAGALSLCPCPDFVHGSFEEYFHELSIA
jgi:hypothetical protein